MMTGFDSARDSHARFPTTSWAFLKNLKDLSQEKRGEAYGLWISRYWKPIYAYFRSKGQRPHEAEDLVQGFVNSVFENDRIAHFDQNESRFRDWLMVCARNYLIDKIRQENAAKRRPSHGALVSFEELRAVEGRPFEPQINASPEQAFQDAWRRNLVASALDSVEAEAQALDRSGDVEIFLAYYAPQGEIEPTWEEVANRFGLHAWKEAARKADWVKRRLGRAIRQHVRQYVETETEIDEEIRELLR